MNVNIKLDPSRFKSAEYERNTHVITIELGTDRETILSPEFWAHIAFKLRPWDKIEARSDDGTFYAEYIVLAAERTWAKVHEIMYVNLTSTDVSMTQAAIQNDEYEVKWRGPHLKHSIIRKSDGAVIAENIQTKDEALLRKIEMSKTLA